MQKGVKHSTKEIKPFIHKEEKKLLNLKDHLIRNKNLLLTILGLVIFTLILLYIYSPTDCGNDKVCFDKYAKTCSRSKITASFNGNMFNYEIKGSQNKDCIINIKLSEVNPNTPLDVKNKLLGRSMLCKIPKINLSTQKLEDTNKLLDSCTGPLKEGMLELIIEKMYSIIIQNMGKITTELEKTLKPISA